MAGRGRTVMPRGSHPARPMRFRPTSRLRTDRGFGAPTTVSASPAPAWAVEVAGAEADRAWIPVGVLPAAGGPGSDAAEAATRQRMSSMVQPGNRFELHDAVFAVADDVAGGNVLSVGSRVPAMRRRGADPRQGPSEFKHLRIVRALLTHQACDGNRGAPIIRQLAGCEQDATACPRLVKEVNRMSIDNLSLVACGRGLIEGPEQGSALTVDGDPGTALRPGGWMKRGGCRLRAPASEGANRLEPQFPQMPI